MNLLQKNIKFVLILIAVIIPFNVCAQLTLPSIFSNNMVLQRDAKIPVWGKAEPEVRVLVKFHGQKKVTTSDKEGGWKVYLSPVSVDINPQKNPPESPFRKGEMTIESGKSKITLKNVVVGDVWLCSGQSNMEFPLKEANDAEKYISEATNSNIRCFQAGRDNFKPYECDNCSGKWKVSSPDSVEDFTAVGYFYGLELFQKLNIPIGLIQADYGGTEIEAWMNSEDLKRWTIYHRGLKALEKYKNNQKFSYYRKKEKEEWYKKLKAIDPGFKNNWMNPDINVSDWKKITPPFAWDSPDLKNHPGFVWYRKKINIPRKWKGKNVVISLGMIRGYDVVWLNGKQIDATLEVTGSWTERNINIPRTEFKFGENTIVICNLADNGNGGLRGPKGLMKIYEKGGSSDFVDISGAWLYKKGYEGEKFPEFPASFSLGRKTLSIQYNSLIHPIIPYAIRGIIWYQGESNRHNPGQYKDLFVTMVKSWRDEWGEGDLPFYFVQIAPYRYNKIFNTAYLREAQFKSLSLTNTGMAVTLDIGDIKNIHPKNKKEVGHRLALCAFTQTYGFTNLVYSGPLYKTHKISGNKIIISFDYAQELKTRDGKPLSCFEIAGDNKKFYPADAKIVNNEVIVSSEKEKKPIAVRFAWSNTAEPNLCNAAGLPASSFRTDKW